MTAIDKYKPRKRIKSRHRRSVRLGVTALSLKEYARTTYPVDYLNWKKNKS